MIEAIAVDDEPKALEVIKFHAEKLDELSLQACFNDPREALQYLKQNPVDLIFLDVNMPILTGFDFLKELRMKYHIVFTTAYSEYAVQSYEVEAVDYLLKPFEFDRFWQAVQKVKQIKQSQLGEASKEPPERFIFVGDGYKKVRLDFDQILFVEGSGNYLTIHTSQQKVMTRLKMYEMLQKLPPEDFIRIHNSYVVNLKKISHIEHNQVHVEGSAISISGKYREEFLRRVESLG